MAGHAQEGAVSVIILVQPLSAAVIVTLVFLGILLMVKKPLPPLTAPILALKLPLDNTCTE